MPLTVDSGIHEWQLNGRRQQQHRGSEAVKLWAEIWNFTRESWSGIPDFCLKLLCLTAPVLLPMTVQLPLVDTRISGDAMPLFGH